MKEIPLTKGMVALVDDCDFEFLNQWKWCASKSMGKFYAIRNTSGIEHNTIKMHRVILSRMTDENFVYVDHANGFSLDNQRANLRPATNGQNM